MMLKEYTYTKPKGYRVILNYFRDTGKWSSKAECISEKTNLSDIWLEVVEARAEKRLPGLIEGHSDFLILIDVPDHPHNHYRLLM